MSNDSQLIETLEAKIEKLRGDTDAKPLAEMASNTKIKTTHITLKNRKVLKGHFAKVYSISWSGKKRLVSASQDGKMVIWDAFTTNKLLAVPLKSSWVMTCTFSPNEKFLASGGLDNTVSVFSFQDSKNNQINVRELKGHEGYISCLRFVDDERLVSSSGDSTCILWNVKERKQEMVFDQHSADVMAVAIKKTSHLFVSGSCDATARVFDLRAGKQAVMAFTGHESDINSVCFVTDTQCVATGSDDSSCRLFDMRSRRQLNMYVADNILCGVTSVASSLGGKYLFAGYDDYSIFVWDMLTGEKSMNTSAHENRVSCLDISRDGMALATGSWDTFVKIWA